MRRQMQSTSRPLVSLLLLVHLRAKYRGGASAFSFSSSRLQSPRRLMMTIDDATQESLRASVAVNNGDISSTSLVVLQQNLLAKSLGSNTIPWVLTLSSVSLEQRADAALASHYCDDDTASSSSWKDWKKSVLSREYLKSFHKNFDSGDYSLMRSFWGRRHCNSPEDVTSLPGLTWKGEDTVSYYSKSKQTVVTAQTLRGVLCAEPAFQIPFSSSLSLAHVLFDDIVSLEERVFDWTVRGPRLFRSILGKHHLFPGADTNSITPDIVALQEYDVHSVQARYRGDGEPIESFSEAMEKEGYSGVFYSDPLKSRTPPSGIAIYFRHHRFELCDSHGNITNNEISDSNETPWTTTLPCGECIGGTSNESSRCMSSPSRPAVINMDLDEHWTPHPQDQEPSTPRRMPAADRRNAAFVRLRERTPPFRIVHVINVHLMTTSRDCAKTNLYPGEVRAGELATLQEMVREHVLVSMPTTSIGTSAASTAPTLLVLGDFNTEPDELQVFQGNLAPVAQDVSSDQSPSLPHRTIYTGFSSNSQEDCLQSSSSSSLSSQPSSSFQWRDGNDNPLTLWDAFSAVHRHQKGSNHCTSRNADGRCSWIDYVFHTNMNGNLTVEKLSDTTPPQSAIPDKVTHGSDHLALAVKFCWKE